MPHRPGFFTLVHSFPLRPIREDADYAAAVEVLEGLVTKDEGHLSAVERDYLDALTRFVEDFDDSHYPLDADARSPLERLKALMETAGVTPAGLGDIIGSRPAASMVLGGRRELSKAQIRKLAEHFKLDAGYFF